MVKTYKTIVPKGEFKAKMFEFLRLVEETECPILVTDYGKPAVIVSPYQDKKSIDELFLPFRGKLKVKGNLFDSENEEWGELG